MAKRSRLPLVIRLLLWPIQLLRLCLQSVLLAIGQIWANKFRSVLTTLGIVIGVASVTAVIAAMTGLRDNVLKEFEAIGTNKMWIYVRQPDSRNRYQGWEQIRMRPKHTVGLLAECPNVGLFSRMTNRQQDVTSPSGTIQAAMHGIDPSWHKIENRNVMIGRPFSILDEGQARPVCLVTEETRDELRLPIDCVGRTILIGQRTFYIIGVVESSKRGGMFGADRKTFEIFIPFDTHYKHHQRMDHVIATSASPEQSDEARAELRFFFRKTRGLRPGETDNFEIGVMEDLLDQFNRIALTMTLVAGGIVSISLLVGGIGIMNIMLVSVSERTREIGLRKAVGAKPTAILLQFLVEAVMVCFLGGVIGVFLGQALTGLLANIPDAELKSARVPMWAIGMSFGFTTVVGVIFGMFPAIKAARLNPIEALRHE